MKRLFVLTYVAVLLAIALAVWPVTASDAANAANAKAGRNPFGVMLGVFQANKAQVVDDLRVAYYRTDPAVTLSTWDGVCAVCDQAKDLGLELVLTVYNNRDASERMPSTPPDDLDVYKDRLQDVIAAVQPEVLAVENEQDNLTYYAGTPEQYGETLQAACEVAHEHGVACTDGGILGSTVAAAVYQHYLDIGEPDKADSFARRAANNDEAYENFVDPISVERRRDKVVEGLAYLAEYKPAGADYVNFHWYARDGAALKEAISYLEDVSGLPAMTNEIGQRSEDPANTADLMDAALDMDLRYVVWFSVDRHRPATGANVVALSEEDGTLRSTGRMFAEFIAERINKEVDRTISISRRPKRPHAGEVTSFPVPSRTTPTAPPATW